MHASAEPNSSGPAPKKKRLFIRVSSLGDVILSTAALMTDSAAQSTNDWVVGEEFATIVRGHPRLRKVWALKRKSGLLPWLRLCRELWNEQYDEVIDLHSSVRSWLARLLFALWSAASPGRRVRWVTFSKDRVRLVGYFAFKGLWPRTWRPRLVSERSAQAAGGTGAEKPDLRHLMSIDPRTEEIYKVFLEEISAAARKVERSFIGTPSAGTPRWLAVMPSSHWKGKRWSVRGYRDALVGLQERFGWIPVVMGQPKDEESLELVEELKAAGVVFISGVGKWNLPQSARIIGGSVGYLGSDTGLAHLSEAVGVPATVIFGPTAWDLGFGPWREQSRGVEASLWCRPCSKDGQACFRLTRRYECLNRVTAEMVLEAFEKAR